MQCKDIPDQPVLAFLEALSPRWATWFEPQWNDNSVLLAMPPETPPKLACAKMKQMIRNGTVSGCPCGCRGDYVITDKGRERVRKP